MEIREGRSKYGSTGVETQASWVYLYVYKRVWFTAFFGTVVRILSTKASFEIWECHKFDGRYFTTGCEVLIKIISLHWEENFV